jgi:hypothetical protein
MCNICIKYQKELLMNKNKVGMRYSLPKNSSEAMRKLAEILKVPTHKLIGDKDQIVMTMSGPFCTDN